MDVSVIIVSYNTKELTRNCLNSIFEKTTNISFEVIISDNGSTDGSIEMIKTEFPQVVLIENGANIGFGAANNRGAAVSHGKYLLLLNSDTVLLNNAIKHLYDVAEREECILGAFLCDHSGDAVSSYGTFTDPFSFLLKKNVYDFYPSIKAWRLAQIKKKSVEPVDKYVDFVTGADLFISRAQFDAVGGFDEGFFMYFEDDDLCRRCLEKGVKSKLVSLPKIVHLEGASSPIKLRKLLIQDKSFFYYVKKWERPIMRFLISFVFWLVFPMRLFSNCLSIKEKLIMLKFNMLQR